MFRFAGSRDIAICTAYRWFIPRRKGNKDIIRQAFTEYRALREFGDGKHGVYTKFRRGPVEVFMIDPEEKKKPLFRVKIVSR